MLTSSFNSPAVIALALLAVAAVVLLGMVVSDWRHRRISNRAILAYLALFIPFYLTSPITPVLWQALLAALVVFLFTFFCFSRGWLGGGDAKLIPAVALWLGPQATWPFLLLMAVGGCIVAVLVLLVAGRRRREWKRLKLPYGVAIVFAALMMMGIQYGQPLLQLLTGTEGAI